ncbi:MAG: hypothetical protein KA170_18825 [Candidatus Promineofilum sp.]|nr:hypothetical protein [Promineifilum sp.]
MTRSGYRLPDLDRPFARTNVQTIAQRVGLLRELLPDVRAIGELCCGDCRAQWATYRRELPIERYHGLDLHPGVVAANRSAGIDCVQGDALEPGALRPFLGDDVLFFGPPLSVNCDGHTLLPFRAVTPGYADLVTLLFGQLGYDGTLVCIAPRATTPGDMRWLYETATAANPGVGLRLIHHSYATLTGAGEPHEPRLKYVELWLSTRLPDRWETRASRPVDQPVGE